MTIPTGTSNFKKPQALIRLEEEWNANPLKVIAVIGVALAGVARFVEAVGSLQSKRAYARLHGK